MRRAVLAAVVMLSLVGCHRGGEDEHPDAAPAVSRADEIDNEKLIAWLKGMSDRNPATGVRQRLVEIYLRRGLMRGRLDDFENCIHYASQEVDAKHDATSYRTRARCEMSLHRFRDAAADLESARHHYDSDPLQTLSMAGDVAFQLGRYDEAERDYRGSLKKDDPETMVRLANYDVAIGDLADADGLFDDAERLPLVRGDAEFHASLEVMRGLRDLEFGAIDDAADRLGQALALDPKNALAGQFHAQALELQGHADEAKAEYERQIAESDSAELMSRLSLLERAQGDVADADRLRDAAAARYRADVAAFPEALRQHYGLFLLDQHLDPAGAIDALSKDAEDRPNAVSWTALAWAQAAGGKVADAQATIAKALATPVRSARTFWTAAWIAEVAGDAKAAAAMRAQALSLNPRIADLMPSTAKPD